MRGAFLPRRFLKPLIIVVLLAASPLLLVEGIYRYSIGKIPLPLAPPPPSGLQPNVTRALWVGFDEAVEIRLAPIYPHRFLRQFLPPYDMRPIWPSRRSDASPGSMLALVSAREMLTGSGTYRKPHLTWIREWTALSMWLSRHWTVEQLIDFCASTSYFGRHIYGIEQGSINIFGKKPNELSLSQTALLGGILHYPRGFDPWCYPEKSKQRRDVILRRMNQAGFINSQELEHARAEPLGVRALKSGEKQCP